MDERVRKLQPNIVTLNALVDGMCKHGRVHRAVEFFNEMKGKGMKGNATYLYCIDFCFLWLRLHCCSKKISMTKRA
uniref:Pentatricopeptide repeat-containing protein At5g28460 n=1 Tax=Cajanus cajan TaxID=3821 RepID=A0A151UCQ0_CAJCA|nr:Pentatricopeptide repeat-containing protein At5g28460 [Cajanus cajan]